MKVRLELAHKKAKVKKVLLKADTVIGRSTECGLRIASNEVSRQHCKICIGEDGVTVRDLGSSNGTFVNGYQLEPETDYEIAPDSELSLGGIKFFVRFAEPAGKVMQTDGLGSTVDLKPHQYAALAETAVLSLAEEGETASPDAAEEELEFAEAEAEEPAEVTPAEIHADSDSGTVQMARPANLDSSAPAGSDVELSAHGDSAILERDDESAFAAETAEAEVTAEAEEEVADLELDEPEEAIVEEEAEEIADLELEAEQAEEPFAEADDLEAEAEEEFDEEEPALEEDSATAETEEAEREEAEAEEEADNPAGLQEAASEEINEDDVAAFLNQVAEEDAGAADDEESLGDFFQQFDS